MTMTDLKEKLVDCNIAIGLAIVGVLYNWIVNNALLDSIYGLLLGIVLIEGIARLGYLVAKTRALGEADTYVAAALGACFGLMGLLYTLVYSLIAAMIFIIPMFLYKQFKNNNKLVCILFILFTLAILVYKTLLQNWYMFGLLATLGIVLSIAILKNLKAEENPLYLPLVPAFSLGALYFLFF